jgi:hypothetical protein
MKAQKLKMKQQRMKMTVQKKATGATGKGIKQNVMVRLATMISHV